MADQRSRGRGYMEEADKVREAVCIGSVGACDGRGCLCSLGQGARSLSALRIY